MQVTVSRTSSSQAVTIACETMTEKEAIIATAIENKLYTVGHILKSKGYDIKCPGNHAGCTANLGYTVPHSEYELAGCIATELAKEGILLEYVTTDGDWCITRNN